MINKKVLVVIFAYIGVFQKDSLKNKILAR